MRIGSAQQIAGLPAMEVRHLVRRIGNQAVALSFVADALDVSEEEAKSMLRRLRDDGYVEPRRYGDTEYWGLTVEGRALAMATAAKPIKRSTADKVLREFMERVQQVNRDEHFLYHVAKVVVFGSYLSSKPELGDVDLAVELRPKHADRDRQSELENERINAAMANGRRFGTIVEQICWPQLEVRLFLKARKRSLSLHAMDDGVLKVAEHKVLYEETRGPTPRAPAK